MNSVNLENLKYILDKKQSSVIDMIKVYTFAKACNLSKTDAERLPDILRY